MFRKTKIPLKVKRKIELWRPVENCTPKQLKRARMIKNGKALIEVDIVIKDLVVDAGLDACCGCVFDGSADRPAAFTYIAIGTGGTAPTSTDTALEAEVMREAATYTKTGNTGECTIEATFNFTASYGIQESGIFNASSGGTMMCRDTFPVKNVESGDQLTITYTATFSTS